MINKVIQFSVLALILTLSLETAAVDSFQCVTYIPTTSAIVKKSGDQLTLDYIHHNGVEFAPIHSGIITAYDLPRIARKGELMAQMGDRITVSFEAKNCKTHGEGNYHCFSNNPLTIGNLDVKSYGFITHQSKSNILGSEFKEFSFRFYVRTLSGDSLESEMDYPLNTRDCVFKKF